MLKTRIIPCLDVKDGRVVKGVRFVELRDAGDPVEAARAYDAQGADELCFLDITASHEKRGTLIDIVRRTAEQCFMPLTVGGGVRTLDDIRQLLLAGADKVSINTAAVRDPGFVARAAEKFGSQCIVVAIDARETRGEEARSADRETRAEEARSADRETGGEEARSADRETGKWDDAQNAGRTWQIYTHGGREPTGIDAIEFASKVVDLGAGEILLTSMDRDGTRAGFDLALTRAIADAVEVPVIASGGVGTLDHLVEGVTEGHASAVLAASIFHFGEHTIAGAKRHMIAAGVPMRLDPADVDMKTVARAG